jgi:AcrR family transcriptional regulator
MPTPPRTSLPDIIRAARHLLEAEGLEHLTMLRVAQAVGVRGPSLYKHVRDRGDLVRLIGNDAIQELSSRVSSAATYENPRQDLQAMARTLRGFARDYPETYSLLWARLPDAWRFDQDLNVLATEPLLRAVASLVGEADRLAAARMVFPWVHGFITMELAGAFRLGGDVDAAFEFGLARLVAALSRPVRSQRSGKKR